MAMENYQHGRIDVQNALPREIGTGVFFFPIFVSNCKRTLFDIIVFNDLMVNMIRKHFLYRQLVLSFFLFCPRLLAVIRAITSPYGNLIITCEYNR